MIRDATDGRDGLMDCDFGTLLRQFRRSAGLTQEALAERSQISVDAISALERRRRKTPHRDTVSLLAAGLELKSDQHQALVAAAEHERPRGVTGPVAGSSSPRQLPRAPAGFVGRSAEIDALSSLLSTAAGTSPVAVCAVVSGMGGIGKTALAVQIAHRVAGQFPDGQVFVDMHGQSLGGSLWPQDAIAQVLRAFGSTMDDDGGDLAATAALYRSRMAGRRALLVLDDVRELDQLIPLLPGDNGCAVLATSREALSALAGICRVSLEPLSSSEALQLLGSVAGIDRVQAEPTAAQEVVERCGNLPLAVQIAGARLASRPDWPIGYAAAKLADRRMMLEQLQLSDVAVRATFTDSLERLAASSNPLNRAAAAAFAHIGLLDSADISVLVTSRLLDVSQQRAETILDRLADLSLLQPMGPGRFRLHDLLAAYANERAAEITGTERSAAITRVLMLYLAMAWQLRNETRHQVPGGLSKDEATAFLPEMDLVCRLTMLDAELHNLPAIASRAADTPGVPPRLVRRLALDLVTFYFTRHHPSDWKRVVGAALRTADSVGEQDENRDLELAWLHIDSGLAHFDNSEHTAALELLRAGGTEFRVFGHVLDWSGQAEALEELGLLQVARGANTEGMAKLHAGLELACTEGDRRREASIRAELGSALEDLGLHTRSAEHQRIAIEILDELDEAVPTGQ